MSLVSRDLEELARAADEFFEHSFETPIALREIQNTEPEGRAEAEEKLLPKQQFADGFYRWLRYLVWLEGLIEFSTHDLSLDEIEGIRVLRAARNRFLRAHPPCRHCGEPEIQTILYCRFCGGALNP